MLLSVQPGVTVSQLFVFLSPSFKGKRDIGLEARLASTQKLQLRPRNLRTETETNPISGLTPSQV